MSEPCTTPMDDGAMWVTADCVDAEYAHPVIDETRDELSPVPHRLIVGHFEGAGERFNIYLPPRAVWRHRFFQSVYPLDGEVASPELLEFAHESGAFVVQTNSSSGYRADAAAAKFARRVAAEHYETAEPIHGFVFGASGGSFQTIGAIENTTGVWDGAVPIVIGVPTSLPNNFFIRAFARLVLESNAAAIADAVAPGGSGDPFARLDEVDAAVLREVSEFGIPLRAWEDADYLFGRAEHGGLLGFGDVVRMIDPSYADDFWSQPGYLGTEESPLGDRMRALAIDHRSTVVEVTVDDEGRPTSVLLDTAAAWPDPAELDHQLLDGDGAVITRVVGVLDPETRVLVLSEGNDPETLARLVPGAQLCTDNRWAIALCTYHRHQVPDVRDLYAFEQFRDPTGAPRFPQRAAQIGPMMLGGISGRAGHNGSITGKVIVIDNLVDADAFPWHADWYAKRVHAALGDDTADHFRLWINDHVDHQYADPPAARAGRLVPYRGIVQRALRDLCAWVEDGTAPPSSTSYEVEDGQILVPATAADRRGVQPVATLRIDGETTANVAAGTALRLNAEIELPPGAGALVELAWDPWGTGDARPSAFDVGEDGTVVADTTVVYDRPGTYFASVRATAQRAGDEASPFGRVSTLGRARVVVT